MAEELNIAIIGHVDHGKSSLLAAISQSLSKAGLTTFVPYEQIDLAMSDKSESGLKMNRAVVKVSGKEREYNLFDFPSHQDYIKSLITTPVIDGILLVVSAADGTMPQTREHLHLAKEIGVKHLVFVLNKADMVSGSLQEIVKAEVTELLKEEGFLDRKCDFIRGSALLARNCGCGKRECPRCGFLFEIVEALDAFVKDPAAKSAEPFLFTVDEAFDTPFGLTLAKGKLIRGILKKDEKVRMFLEKGFAGVKVKALELDGNPVEQIEAPSPVSIYLEGIKAEPVVKGSMVVPLSGDGLKKDFEALIYLNRKEENGREAPFESGSKTQFSFWGRAMDGSIILPKDRKMVMPGDNSTVSVKLNSPVVLEKGFVFSIVEKEKNVGIGKIVEVME